MSDATDAVVRSLNEMGLRYIEAKKLMEKGLGLRYPSAHVRPVDGQISVDRHLAARFHDDFESAVLHAVNGGGQNQAQTGLSGMLQRFPDGLEDSGDLRRLAERIALQA